MPAATKNDPFLDPDYPDFDDGADETQFFLDMTLAITEKLRPSVESPDENGN